MNKKRYITPDIEVLEMEIAAMLCMSANMGNDNFDEDDDDPTEGEEMNANYFKPVDIWE